MQCSLWRTLTCAVCMCVVCLVFGVPQDEISEMKRKFKIMSHQIEQLKEEIAAKDLALVKEHFDHIKVCRACFMRRAHAHCTCRACC